MTYILGIIPARGGSKGIPNKNIARLNNKPLIAYTIQEALKSQYLDDVILSTDSKDIAECSAKYGLNISSLRPKKLALDDTSSIDVIIYEVQKYESEHNITVDVIVLLQPTAPLRNSTDIDGAISKFIQLNSDSMISVCKISSGHPSHIYYIDNDKLKPIFEEYRVIQRRQELKPYFLRNGALYISKKSILLEQRSFIIDNLDLFIMPSERSINIDEPFDLDFADWIMKRQI